MTRMWRTILIVSLFGNLTIAYVGYKAWEYRGHINHFLDKYRQVVAEFSGRSVYKQANMPLWSDTQVDNRVVFFGTQVTENWDLDKYFSEYETINRGISGQRVAGYLLRFRSDVIALYPRAVVIEVSSYNFRPNSTIEEICDYVASMADMAVVHDIHPILTTVIPPQADYTVEEYPDYSVVDSVKALNDWLKNFTTTNLLPLADLCGTVAGPDGYLRVNLASSRVDLNDEGYKLIAEVIRNELISLN